MNRIDTITLTDLLPNAFMAACDNEKIVDSELWLGEYTFEREKYYIITAESGTGKSSLCNYIYGLRHDYAGRITFNGENIATFDMDRWCKLRRSHLAYLPQDIQLFPELTAIENVMLKNRLTDFRTEADIRSMFEALEIDHRIEALACQMSLGQQQKVGTIRALCQPFDFVVLDEPMSHLDDHSNEICSQLIAHEAKEQNAGIISTSVGYLPIIELPIIQLAL